jgi:hypothetical protein
MAGSFVISNKDGKYFNKDKNFYVCSYGCSGSWMLVKYLANFGNAYHIHSRKPPNKLTYVGSLNSPTRVYAELFNKVEIPDKDVVNYKVIYIYRDPVIATISCINKYGKNKLVDYMNHIETPLRNHQINLQNLLSSKSDYMMLEDHFDNYMKSRDNYDIYAIKYDRFFSNISSFNKAIGVVDDPSIYPKEIISKTTKNGFEYFDTIYEKLIAKMNKLDFLTIVYSKSNKMEDKPSDTNTTSLVTVEMS